MCLCVRILRKFVQTSLVKKQTNKQKKPRPRFLLCSLRHVDEIKGKNSNYWGICTKANIRTEMTQTCNNCKAAFHKAEGKLVSYLSAGKVGEEVNDTDGDHLPFTDNDNRDIDWQTLYSNTTLEAYPARLSSGAHSSSILRTSFPLSFSLFVSVMVSDSKECLCSLGTI